MSDHPPHRDDRSVTPVGLLNSLLGCDDRARRARSLMITASACVALLALAVIALLALAATLPRAIGFGATGVIGGGLFTALAAVNRGKSLRRRHRDGDKS